jgi:hypothetical protein
MLDQLTARLSSGPPSMVTAVNPEATTLPAAPLLPPCLPFRVKYMSRQAYIDVEGPKCTAIKTYFEDATGTSLPSRRRDYICDVIQRFWRSLRKYKVLPDKWGHILGEVFEWFKANVYALCPKLRFCEDDWKLQYYCQGHFSSWHTKTIGPSGKRDASALGNSNQGGQNDEDRKGNIKNPHPAKRARTIGACGSVPFSASLIHN